MGDQRRNLLNWQEAKQCPTIWEEIITAIMVAVVFFGIILIF